MLRGEVGLQFIMSMDKLMEVVKKVIVDGHLKGSRGIHNRVKKDSSAVDIKRISQSKFDIEITELKERISIVT